MHDRHIGNTISDPHERASRIPWPAQIGEVPERRESGMLVRALLLILGGIAIVSYVMMTLAHID